MVYTSYFANLRKLPSTVYPVGISLYPPHWFTGETYEKLSPSRELLLKYKSNNCTIPDYWDEYWSETLSKLDPVQVYNELQAKGTPDVAILCFEAPDNFCHRFITSHWLTQSTGIAVREYGCDQHIVFGG